MDDQPTGATEEGWRVIQAVRARRAHQEDLFIRAEMARTRAQITIDCTRIMWGEAQARMAELGRRLAELRASRERGAPE